MDVPSAEVPAFAGMTGPRGGLRFGLVVVEIFPPRRASPARIAALARAPLRFAKGAVTLTPGSGPGAGSAGMTGRLHCAITPLGRPIHPHPSPLPSRERGHRHLPSHLDFGFRRNDVGVLVDEGFVGAGG